MAETNPFPSPALTPRDFSCLLFEALHHVIKYQVQLFAQGGSLVSNLNKRNRYLLFEGMGNMQMNTRWLWGKIMFYYEQLDARTF